jgi:L-rhamnose isomerase
MSTIRGSLLLAGGLVLWAGSAGAQTPPPATRLTPAAPYACDHDRARAEVKRLTDTGVIAELSRFPPNVSVIVDKRQWDKTAAPLRRRWAQEVACATGEGLGSMLRTVTFRARDTSLLGSFSNADLKD